MVVVDTTVWIDLFRGRRSTAVDTLESLLAAKTPVALTDVVYMELLQGARSDGHERRLAEHLLVFPILHLAELADFRMAADLYRAARAAGVTVRSKLDFLIAAPCIRIDAPVLHSDSDFDRIASCTALRVYG